MAKSNRDRVTEVLDALKVGLGPVVVREFKTVYRKDYDREIEAVLTTGAYGLPPNAFQDADTLLASVDTAGWLKLMFNRWNEVFKNKLGHAERSYVSELLEARHKWAHQNPFTLDDAYRVADTATRLLQAVSAADAAQTTQDIANELLRLRFKAEEEKARKNADAATGELTTRPGLKPWRLVVQPHADVASGRYVQAEFAADLAQVIRGKAEPEYGDPIEFFRRTYLTQGLLDLLATGVRRLWGQGGDPVVQLQTSFGGGKTHSMLALYHLVSGDVRLSDITGGERIAERVGEQDLPKANRAVLVGTALDPAKPRQYRDATTYTLWGELAYQLGGVEAYHLIESADLKGVNPGSDTLLELLEQFGPALIIIDELVAYARNVYGVNGLPAGSFDAVMSFIQSLTEAVRRSSDSMLLVSIPESKIEIGGEGGHVTLDILAKTVGRIESVWKPVTATESFEIVRRRLFASEMDYAARDAVVSAFMEMYHRDNREYPSHATDGDYRKRLADAYPIHPELFDRLYQDWSTLERFQRTRGVLRLMAAVIHVLWTRNDQSLMIMPGMVPLDADTVRNEMLRYLPEGWSAIVDTDVDGPNSRPYAIDGDVPALGRYSACRRVARAVFIGSAPSVAAQGVRGVDELSIRLAAVQPGENASILGDALKRMGNQLTYLYSDGNRYWYDTRPTVNKMARDRAQAVPDGDVEAEIIARLRKEKNTAPIFSGHHAAPAGSGDVVDEPRARVVVLGPRETHKRGNEQSAAIQVASTIFETRGNAPRIYRNMLVFIAPDENDYEALERAVRDYLAWKSIHDEEEQLNLDAQQRKQVRASVERANETVDLRVQTAYSWLLVPDQPDPTGPVQWQAHRIAGDDSFYQRAARKLKQSELLITQWSPDNLRMTLDEYLWRDAPHIGVKQLWEYFATYCYLPRVKDHEVLLDAIQAGIERLDAPFAYATGVNADGTYRGLAFRKLSKVYFDATSVVVQRDVAEKMGPEQPTSSPKKPTNNGGTDDPQQPSATVKRRYYGSVRLDPQRVNREVGVIVDEIIQHLTSLAGSKVEIRLEITAHNANGFDETVQRTLNENSRTLHFDAFGFEAE